MNARRFFAWLGFLAAVTGLAVLARGPEAVAKAPAPSTAQAAPTPAAAPVASPAAGTEERSPRAVTPARGRGDVAVTTRSYAVPPGRRLVLSVDHGDVELVPASRSDIRVDMAARSGTDEDAIVWTESVTADGALRVRIRSNGDDSMSGLGGLARVLSGRQSLIPGPRIESLRVEVPPDLALSVDTGAGDVPGRGLGGDVKVQTGAGDVSLGAVTGSVRVSTGAGDVSVTEARGSVEVDTGAGDVSVEGAPGSVDADSGAGDISISGTPGRIDVDTGVGEVTLRVSGLREAIRVSTGMGEIDAVVSGAFDLEADTGLSSVTVVADGGTIKTSGVGGHVRRTVGVGGPKLRLSSGGGEIRVRADGPAGTIAE